MRSRSGLDRNVVPVDLEDVEDVEPDRDPSRTSAVSTREMDARLQSGETGAPSLEGDDLPIYDEGGGGLPLEGLGYLGEGDGRVTSRP